MPVEKKSANQVTPPCGTGALIASGLVFGGAVVAASLVLLKNPLGWLETLTPLATPTMPSFGVEGIGSSTILLGAILFMLFFITVLLMLLVFCSCCCKGIGSGLRLPELPKNANVLRNVAMALNAAANEIETANEAVDPARDLLTSVTSFKITVPKFTVLGNFDLGVYNGEIWIPDGLEEKPLFDSDGEAKLNTFTDDITGKTTLGNASTLLRQQADILEQQANMIGASP